jgi:hypothetical protein
MLEDEQNGFRKRRSTIDQLSTLTNIVETRLKSKRSTFVAYINFSKAYDSVNRDILWKKLANVGVNGKMFLAVKSIYSNVTACVQVNNLHTNWFNVNNGLRQGCGLSPILFNFYVNDLAVRLKALGLGVDIGNEEKLCILLYADDIVFIAETEEDLQSMLDVLYEWSCASHMKINPTKSNVMHFRPNNVNRTNFVFKCGPDNRECVPKYVYLG